MRLRARFCPAASIRRCAPAAPWERIRVFWKKAAAAVGEKSVAMLPVAKLVQTVGYARGACSPIGMKKQFVTVFDASALTQDKIFISGGQLGSQICLKPEDAIGISCARTADITR